MSQVFARWRSLVSVGLLWAAANIVAWTCLDARERRLQAESRGVDYEIETRFEERVAEFRGQSDSIGIRIPYRLLPPNELQAERRYPVILFLHGSGERGSDNIAQLRGLPSLMSEPARRRRFPCYLVVPQCPADTRWSGRDGNSYGSLKAALAVLEDVLAKDSGDPERVYLIGYSMGAFGAWELAARHPNRFAALVPVAGGGQEEWAKRLVRLPVWAVHGAADEVVPLSSSGEMIEALQAAGGEPRYLVLPGVGHDVWQVALTDSDDILNWLFRQRRDSPARATMASAPSLR